MTVAGLPTSSSLSRALLCEWIRGTQTRRWPNTHHRTSSHVKKRFWRLFGAPGTMMKGMGQASSRIIGEGVKPGDSHGITFLLKYKHSVSGTWLAESSPTIPAACARDSRCNTAVAFFSASKMKSSHLRTACKALHDLVLACSFSLTADPCTVRVD